MILKFIQKSLFNQLVTSFSALFLVVLGAVTVTAYVRAKQALQNSIYDRLNVAVSLKEYELNQWFYEQRNDTLLLTQNPLVRNNINLIVQRQKNPKVQTAYTSIKSYFEQVLLIKKHMQDISLLSAGGIVVLSTDETLEGTYQGLGNITTYFEPDQTQVIPNFYQSPLTKQPAITLATPVLDPKGDRLGVITVNLNLRAVDNLVRQKTGLGETGTTYLVGQLGSRNVLIAGDPSRDLTLAEEVSSQGIDEAMAGGQGQGLYTNAQGVPVIGVYRWIPSENFALVAEMNQTEAFQPAAILSRDTIIMGVGSSSILVLAVYFLAVQLSRPILTITKSASDLEAGRFHGETLDRVKERHDELGQLARVFQKMAAEVYQREARLKQQVVDLKIEIDHAKRSQQVAEVTETDYFRDLQQRSQELRQRRKRGKGETGTPPPEG